MKDAHFRIAIVDPQGTEAPVTAPTTNLASLCEVVTRLSVPEDFEIHLQDNSCGGEWLQTCTDELDSIQEDGLLDQFNLSRPTINELQHFCQPETLY